MTDVTCPNCGTTFHIDGFKNHVDCFVCHKVFSVSADKYY